jgi:hypothetical protein
LKTAASKLGTGDGSILAQLEVQAWEQSYNQLNAFVGHALGMRTAHA